MQVPRRVLFWQDKRKESRLKSMKVLTTAERQASLCLSLCACVHARAHATTEASACVLQDYLLPWRPLLTLHSLFPLHTFRSSVALKQTLCVLESKRDSEQTFHKLVKKKILGPTRARCTHSFSFVALFSRRSPYQQRVPLRATSTPVSTCLPQSENQTANTTRCRGIVALPKPALLNGTASHYDCVYSCIPLTVLFYRTLHKRVLFNTFPARCVTRKRAQNTQETGMRASGRP